MDIVIGIIIDIVILLILFLCYKKGAKDGFAKTLVSLLGFVIAIVVASALCAPVSEAVYDNVVRTPIEDAVSSVVSGPEIDSSTPISQGADISGTIEEGIDSLPSFIKDITGIDEKKDEIISTVNAEKEKTIEKIVNTVCDGYIRPVIIKVLSVFVFLILFLAVWLICKIAAKLLKIINKIPLLGGVNKLLGGIIGLVRGLVIVLIVSWVIVMLTADGAVIFGVIGLKTVQSSIILKAVATYNPLNLIIKGLLA